MSSTGQDVVLDTILDNSITGTATGGLKGGFPVVFTSTSLQLGAEPAGIIAKFVDAESPEEIYVLPDLAGDKLRTHLLLCAPALSAAAFNASAAPVIFGQNPTPTNTLHFSNDPTGAGSRLRTAFSTIKTEIIRR